MHISGTCTERAVMAEIFDSHFSTKWEVRNGADIWSGFVIIGNVDEAKEEIAFYSKTDKDAWTWKERRICGHENCNKPAKWQITYDSTPDNFADACHEHLADLCVGDHQTVSGL